MIDLKFDGVSKKYRVRRGPQTEPAGGRLYDKVRGLRRRSQEFWALRDVSFEVRRGEALGIIGHNGAGKSTILKLLSNITAPTAGRIVINGSIAALIEVGSGFHPELTGRENIFLSGSILGMRRREIARKIDDIVAFADIGDYVDVPVKWYSSGMYVRLGFAISAHLDPDILLLDEVLAVGDAAFQARCIRRITDLERAGVTLVFISHDLGAIERLCSRVILLRRGELVAEGPPAEVIARYLETEARAEPSMLPEPLGMTRPGPPPVKITGVQLGEVAGGEAARLRTGEPMIMRVSYSASAPLRDVVFDVYYYSHDGRFLQCQQTTSQSGEPIDLRPGAGFVDFSCAELGLQPGVYQVGASVKPRDEEENLGWWYSHSPLCVEHGKWARGSFYMPHEWHITQQSEIAPNLTGEPAPARLAADFRDEKRLSSQN
jgi:ABC-type polysaccharide/polyol phosphate transport system ATPase subunit